MWTRLYGHTLPESCTLTYTYLIGNYGAQANGALKAANQPTDDPHIRESLFHCNGGNNGDISFIQYCGGGCRDGGSGNSDYC